MSYKCHFISQRPARVQFENSDSARLTNATRRSRSEERDKFSSKSPQRPLFPSIPTRTNFREIAASDRRKITSAIRRQWLSNEALNNPSQPSQIADASIETPQSKALDETSPKDKISRGKSISEKLPRRSRSLCRGMERQSKSVCESIGLKIPDVKVKGLFSIDRPWRTEGGIFEIGNEKEELKSTPMKDQSARGSSPKIYRRSITWVPTQLTPRVNYVTQIRLKSPVVESRRTPRLQSRNTMFYAVSSLRLPSSSKQHYFFIDRQWASESSSLRHFKQNRTGPERIRLIY